MTLSSSQTILTSLPLLPISDFKYKQMGVLEPLAPGPSTIESLPDDAVVAEQELVRALSAERAAGAADAEARLKKEFDERIKSEMDRIADALCSFQQSRKEYFERVEGEVVQLALAIAGKILHRESQVDPMLVAALVQIALNQLKEGSAAAVRVAPAEFARWQAHFTSGVSKVDVEVVSDAELGPGDCLLETQLGSVNFSLDAQLKEVERGFLDVLAQRPQL